MIPEEENKNASYFMMGYLIGQEDEGQLGYLALAGIGFVAALMLAKFIKIIAVIVLAFAGLSIYIYIRDKIQMRKEAEQLCREKEKVLKIIDEKEEKIKKDYCTLMYKLDREKERRTRQKSEEVRKRYGYKRGQKLSKEHLKEIGLVHDEIYNEFGPEKDALIREEARIIARRDAVQKSTCMSELTHALKIEPSFEVKKKARDLLEEYREKRRLNHKRSGAVVLD